MPLPVTSDERQATGRERHDQKITVYLSATELLDLEHARLRLRRFGFVLDRGRLVREAIAILLADLDARGKDSLVARRIRSTQEPGNEPGPDAAASVSQGKDEDKGLSESTGFPETTGFPGSTGFPESTGLTESTGFPDSTGLTESTGFPESTDFPESTVPSLTWAQRQAAR